MTHAAAQQCGLSFGPGEGLRYSGHHRHETLRTKDRLNRVRHKTKRGLQPATNLCHLSRHVRSRDYNRGRARRRPKRFPEPTGRGHGCEPFRIRGVDQQEIHIAVESQVLKSIVEDQAIDRKLIQDPVSELVAISPDRNDRLGTALRHHERLIACLARADQQAFAIRYH